MANVDPSELAKFGEIAHRWWDKESEFQPLHEINPLRLGWIRERVDLQDADVLDVGCGGGILSESLARLTRSTTGIDLAAKALGVARLHALESGLTNLEYLEVPVEELAERSPARFDVVTCMEMLEHVPSPELSVAACARLVRPGGWAFFSTLNRHPMAFLQAILGAEYVLNMLPKGTHEYARFIRPNELTRWCRDAGLTVEKIEGMTYNPLSRQYSLTPDCSVNYMLACRKTA
jgi:2-polyprenyl-6-hydroxyphenyl methylase / 3-demethylubiquinone-9 3-methyltransferase